LKRMWDGDLTETDRKRINSRVIGQNGLALPSQWEGKFKPNLFFYHCQKYQINMII